MPVTHNDTSDRTPLLWRDSRQRSRSQDRLPFHRQDEAADFGALRHTDISGNNAHDQFCALTGCPPSNWAGKTKFQVPKKSLYGRAVSQLTSQRRAYNASASVNNLLLLSQVILGAALTALGASASSHILITFFGATNTIIAGLVAYLKSRGQPMRARMYRDDLERIVDEIENSEIMWRGISEGIHGYHEIDTDDVTVRSEVARLTRLYDRAIRLNGMNNPDMYMAGAGGFDSNTSGGVRPQRGAVSNVPLPAVSGPAPQPSAPNPGPSVPVVENPEDAAPATKIDADKPVDAPAVSTVNDKQEEAPKVSGKQPSTDGATESPSTEGQSSSSSVDVAKPSESVPIPPKPSPPPPPPPAQPAQPPPQPQISLLETDPDASPATAARLKPKRTKSDKPPNEGVTV